MDPSGPSSTSTAAAPASARPRRESAVFDMVKVAPETFRSIEFRAAFERKEFTKDQVPDQAKRQKQTKDGVPVWSVKVLVEDWRGRESFINVTVPMYGNPADKFSRGQQVELPGLAFGVSPKHNGGYVTWQSADGINSTGAGTTAA